MTNPPEISVVIPCQNEQDNLRPLVTGIRSALEPTGRSFEIIITDDASTDRSWETIKTLGVHALRFEYNCGQSAALWAGIQTARGAIIITLDADMQNPPAEIPKFLEALRQTDCVCGSRIAARARGDSKMKILSSQIANAVRNNLSDETISDAGCCYRAFRKECLAGIKFFKGGHRFLPTLIKMEGYRVIEIPIDHHPRHTGHSHYGIGNRLFKSFADLLAVRWMKKRVIRYKIAEEL